MADKSMYRAPGVTGPQIEDLRRLNQEMKLCVGEDQLQEMTKILEGVTKQYQRISEMETPAPPEVKYPRTSGFKPSAENNPFNAWAWRCDIQGAPSGKLSGRTVAIKDNIAVAGVPLKNGSRILENYVPEFDATVVTRILDEGGRILGKSGVEDLCFSGSSVTNVDGPVLNPWNTQRATGGSSSGSAALVASGQVDMALGGDQGGSVRIPSSFTGIVGLKPTYGLVPYTGASAIEPTIDHLGPMTTSVKDCALLLEVLAGYDDGRDPRQFPNMPAPAYSTLVDAGVKGKKVGLLKEGFECCVDEVQSIVMATAKKLTGAGMQVKEVSMPMHSDAGTIWMVSSGQGFYQCMIKDGGSIYNAKGFHATSLQQAMLRGCRAQPDDIAPLVKMYSMFGEYITQQYGKGNKFYSKANNLVYELGRQYDQLLKEVDVLIMPTLPHTAPKIPPSDVSFSDLTTNCLSMTPNTMPFNSTGHPALSINAGFDGQGLPVGLMIVAKKFDDLTALQVARAVEQIFPFQKPPTSE